MKVKNSTIAWILLGLTALVIIFIRVRLLSLPLERDEGEYAYAGQMILQGNPPYRDVYNMKFPGVYYFYALFIFIFGNTITAIHIGSFIVNILTSYFIYKCGNTLKNNIVGLYAGVAYLVLSFAPRMLGPTANTEHFVNLFIAIAAFYLIKWLKDPANKHLFYVGLATGFACLMKQHGAYFLVVAVFAIILKSREVKILPIQYLKKLIILVSGYLIIISLLLLSVLLTETFDKFIFLTISYGKSYIAYGTIGEGIKDFFLLFTGRIRNNHIMWLFIILGIILSLKEKSNKFSWILLVWFVMSCLAIFPGYYFRDHYYLLLIPVVSIYFALFFDYIIKWANSSKLKLRIYAPSLLFCLCISYYLVGEKEVFFIESPELANENLYENSHYFIQSKIVGDYIKSKTKPTENILVIGSEPEVYFYSERKAATSYIYLYPLLENHAYKSQMFAEYIEQARASKPELILSCRIKENNEAILDSLKTAIMNAEADYEFVAYCYYDESNQKNKLIESKVKPNLPKEIVTWEIYSLKKS